MGRPFVHTLRVRYSECDRQGVVFNANYLGYFDVGMTELWREAFGSYDEMVATGVDMVVAEARARYLAPAAFEDELALEIVVTRLGTTGMTTAHSVRRGDAVVVRGELRHVFVDAATQRKVAIPDWIRAGLGAYAE